MVKISKSLLLLLLIFILGAGLRLYHLGSNPPALYWDEASLGVNAYSIATTLYDEHREFLPVGRFIAFGDYKAPGYIYTDALVMKLLGKSEFAVRLPSSLAGILMILVVYWLVIELFPKSKKLALTSAWVTAISPWALQFSRGGFEANLATLFSLTGVTAYLSATRKNSWKLFFLSALAFSASIYTFNSHRIVVPALIAILVVIFWRYWWKRRFGLILFGLALLVLILPQVPFVLSREGKLRFQEVTWLNDLSPIELSNARMIVDDNSLAGKFFHNRRLVYAGEFLQHYFDHFRADFLFSSGDVNPRLSPQTVGELFWIEAPLLLLGLYGLFRRGRTPLWILLAWAVVAPIPAALARETPHALRVLPLLPIPFIIAALGLVRLVGWLKSKRLIVVIWLLVGSYAAVIFSYLHNYYHHYPRDYALSWQYGYKQMVDYVTLIAGNYRQVNVSEVYGRPYIYFLFYGNTTPQEYWSTVQKYRDWYGFWYVAGFKNYHFGDGPAVPNSLYVTEPKGIPAGARLLKTIADPSGRPVFVVSEK